MPIVPSSELLRAVDGTNWDITEVISGTAKGADKLGERFAKENNLTLHRFPADWNRYGKSAGYKRNVEMADNADALLALWDGKSRGTKHMIDIVRSRVMALCVWKYQETKRCQNCNRKYMPITDPAGNDYHGCFACNSRRWLSR